VIPLPGYTYLGPLGTPGTFGAVFHARNDLSGRDVAIKHIDAPMTPDALAAWEAEARAMAACAHDNLVAILHAEITPDGPALVMEYLPDGSVAARFGDDPAPVATVVDVAIEVCWGLHRLQVEGLTHRDIKPGNLLFDAGKVKLGDFGLAGGAGDPANLIYVAHKPPEVQHGRPWTEVADIYALSVTAWRMLWGDGNNGRRAPDLHLLVAAGKWPNRDAWPIHIHKRLRTVLRAGLHMDPGKRPPTAADFRSQLERAKPVVSWSPVGADEWQGQGGGAQWNVRMRSNFAGHGIETTRDAGRGVRRVGAGCAKGLSAKEAESLCRVVLESLAANGEL
jgi:serine/threonine protein kinase